MWAAAALIIMIARRCHDDGRLSSWNKLNVADAPRLGDIPAGPSVCPKEILAAGCAPTRSGRPKAAAGAACQRRQIEMKAGALCARRRVFALAAPKVAGPLVVFS
jgi:hypothetical protein